MPYIATLQLETSNTGYPPPVIQSQYTPSSLPSTCTTISLNPLTLLPSTFFTLSTTLSALA